MAKPRGLTSKTPNAVLAQTGTAGAKAFYPLSHLFSKSIIRPELKGVLARRGEHLLRQSVRTLGHCAPRLHLSSRCALPGRISEHGWRKPYHRATTIPDRAVYLERLGTNGDAGRLGMPSRMGDTDFAKFASVPMNVYYVPKVPTVQVFRRNAYG